MRWGSRRDQTVDPEGEPVFQAGHLLSGTDEQATSDSGPAGLGAGVASIQRADPSFSPDKFTTWSATIYAMATAAWRTADPTVLRPVMATTVYEPYAGFVTLITILPILQVYMASAVARAELTAAHGDDRYDTVTIRYAVTITAAIDPRLHLDDSTGHWIETWTFQRSTGFTTHSSGAVDVCPNCGSPVSPDERGKCRYCHFDLVSRTAGWLVTRTATTMHGIVRAQEVLEGRAAASSVGVAKFIGHPTPPPGSLQVPMQPPRSDQ